MDPSLHEVFFFRQRFFFYIAEAFQFNVDDVTDSTFARAKSANEKLARYYFAR